MFRGKPIVNIDSNSPKFGKVPTQDSFIIKAAKRKAAAMIDHEYRTSVFWKYFWLVDSNCYETSVSDWNLSVVLHV